MTDNPVGPFLDAIRAARLLAPPRVDELAAWAADAEPDTNGLAREIHRRGWLTPYQIRELFQGRGADLVVGPYVLLDPIGEGGMGRVFKARHARLDRVVAVKLIRTEKLHKPLTMRRFQQEIRAASQLSHPNVVLALDADEINGTPYYAMEYVEGTDLAAIVDAHGPMPAPMACEYARQAALGLQHAFEKGLVHRDVKPSNILATPHGQVKLLDLGMAMLKEAPEDKGDGRLTQAGMTLGTPDFLAPEQAQNPRTVDTRADVYGLGASLYYLLTGKPPFDGETATEKLIKHVTVPPPSVLAARPDVPPPLDDLIRAMMAKNPADRPPTPAHVAHALAPFCPPPPGAPTAVVPAPLPGFGLPPPGFGPPPPGFAPPPGFPPPFAPADPMTAEIAAAHDADFAAVSARPAAPRRVYRGRPQRTWVLPLLLFLLVTGGVVAATAGLLYTFRDDLLSGPDEPLPDRFDNPVGMTMIRLSAGSFVMGSPPEEVGRDDDEGPPATVTIGRDFYMAATEVTRSQYLKVTGKTQSKNRPQDRVNTPEDSPTWDEAVEFCRKLTRQDPDRRRGWAYRLPTEAEWEYACRAGTTGPFSYGDHPTQLAQVVCKIAPDDPYLETAKTADGKDKYPPIQRDNVLLPYPVGFTEPNRWGLSGMHGNVWEWCGDYHAAYPAGPRTDPTGPAEGDWRVLRGGAFDTDSAACRSASRLGLDPLERRKNVGFRVVFAPVD